MTGRALIHGATLAALLAAPVPAAWAQPAQAETQADALTQAIVTVDQDAMYGRSAWGRRAEALVTERLRELSAENDRIFAELSAEEASLTEQRATLSPEEFRARATAFDERVTVVRREREEAALQVAALAEAERAAFFSAAIPVIGALMRERGALLVLDPRTVLLSADSIDMTEATIARLNEQIGDGEGRARLPGRVGEGVGQADARASAAPDAAGPAPEPVPAAPPALSEPAAPAEAAN
ncbi:OmpH family outer membrane protein [Paracoccus sp. Z118]|uniref:OmpH family outer membrane protein n=1 Tax=Paracoccus sp. Z118 TaxID=2851017 RepID=UPI001C2B9C9B|nr:OmpH family outer membrane protein [Paracoccus sp. Z118]MBV0890488.1 OmpH family outer membrane protein [Paracoccus sp. Z118]